MAATVEMDRAGRLVIPKRIRESLHLRPGSALQIELRGDEIILSPQEPARGLYEEDGLLIYDCGVPLSARDVNRWVQEERERRTQHILASQ